VTAGKLSREELGETLDAQGAGSAHALGFLLVSDGHVAADHVRLGVQEQILDGLVEIMAWHEGTFDFDPSDVDATGIDVFLPVPRALLEVRRRLGERDAVAATVPLPSTVPQRTDDAPPDGLRPDEARLLGAIDGQTSIADLATRLGLGTHEADRLLYRLVLQGWATAADGHGRASDGEARVTTIAASSATAFRTSAPALDDHGWAERLSSDASSIDEPEPWVGWANGAPRTTPTAPPATPPGETAPPAWRPSPPAFETLAAPSVPAPAAPVPFEPPVPEPRPLHDVDTRSALFSELRSVGHELERIADPATAPVTADASAEPTAAAPAPPAAEADEERPAPSQPISRSDVSDLLRELHALSLDDD
jgi:hypothetical protein